MIPGLTGLVAAPLTGFHSDGTVNTEVVPPYARCLRNDGVVGAYVNGTTGEGQALTPEERRMLASAWISEQSESFRVLIHVTHPDPAVSCELAEHAQHEGACAMGVMGPIGQPEAKLSQVVEWVARIASAAPALPCYYYHIPAVSQVNIPVHALLEKAPEAIPSLSGVKFSHWDLSDLAQCSQCHSGRYEMLYGRDEQLLAALAFGCRGAVGSSYNFMAGHFHNLIDAFDHHDLPKARRLQLLAIRRIREMTKSGNYLAAAKEEMKQRGLFLGHTRVEE